MEPALLLPANQYRAATIVRIAAIDVLLPNTLIVAGFEVFITTPEYTWIKTKLALTSPP